MRYSEFDLMLYVERVDRSVEFYRDALGFDFEGWRSTNDGSPVKTFEEAGRPEYVGLSADEFRLSLHQKDNPAASGAVYHLRVDDLDELHSRLIHKGLEPDGPTDQPWGWRTLTVRDPDAHEWCFYKPIHEGND